MRIIKSVIKSGDFWQIFLFPLGAFFLWWGLIKHPSRALTWEDAVVPFFFGVLAKELFESRRFYKKIFWDHMVLSPLAFLFLAMALYEIVLVARFPQDAMFSNMALATWARVIFATAAAGICILIIILKELSLKKK